jgi:PAS domain S-box-containing protein
MAVSNPQPVRLLLVEDDEEDYRLVRQWLADSLDGPFRLDWVDTLEAANAALAAAEHDTCLLDYRLGPHSGLDLLREAVASDNPTPIILLTGQGDAEVDTAALQAGAADYLVKDEITASTLVRAIRHAIERRRLIHRSQAEQQERLRTEAALSAVVSKAHCLLWQAEVADEGVSALNWRLQVFDVEAAQRFLPLDLTGYPSYDQAWYHSRLPGDREACDQYGGEQVRLGQNFRQEFRCRDRHGSVHWLVEDVQVETLAPGRWRAVGVCTDITAIREAEQALREKSDLLQAVIEGSADPIFVKDQEGRYLLRNTASAAVGKKTSAESVGRPDAEFFLPDTLQQIRQREHEVLRTAVPVVTEDRLVDGGFASSMVVTDPPSLRDGAVRTFLTTRSPFRDASGTVVGVVGIAKDITERKRAEEGLAAQARQQTVIATLGERALHGEGLQDLLDAAAAQVARTLAVEYCKVLELLPNGEELLLRAGVGWQEGLVGQARVGTEHESQAGFTLLSDQPVVVTDLRTETRFTGPSLLHEHQVRSGMSVIIPGEHRPYGVLGAHTTQAREFTADEVTFLQAVANVLATAIQQQGTQDRLRESQERYRVLFDRSPFPKWVFDNTTLAFLAVNDAAVEQYGYSREELLGMTLQEFYLPEDFPRRLEAHQQQRPFRNERFRQRRRDGSVIEVDVTAEPILLDERDAWIVVSQDVTERTALEEQLRQAQKMEAVGRLAGGVAHDFNNLLAVILGYSDMLLRRFPVVSDPTLRDYVEEIRKAGERAVGLTRQMLAFSRKQVLEPQVLDVGELVMKTKGMLRPLIREDIELAVRVEPNLHPVLADPGQLEQVVLNLVVNSRDAMPEGGKLTIEVENTEFDETYAREHPYVAPGSYVMLAVTDTGCGMSTEILKHIFEPFFTTKAVDQGTGLGLSTAFGIIKQSGGHLEVATEVGNGTTFEVYLPRTTTPERVADADRTFALGGSETILVAEDDEKVRSLVRNILEMYGYTVVTATNAAEALDVAAEHQGRLDLLLTDVIMPGGKGTRALAAGLGKQRPGVKVLYMSGYPDEELMGHSILAGEVDFIQKPFTPLSLARKVREVLG